MELGIAENNLFTFLAAVYMILDCGDDEDLQEDFRVRALVAGGLVGVCALAALLLSGDGEVRAGLQDAWWSIPLHIATGVCALTALWALWTRRFQVARAAAILQVTLIVVGWGVAQFTRPDLESHLSVSNSVIAGNHTALPEKIDVYRVPKVWNEDHLLERQPDDLKFFAKIDLCAGEQRDRCVGEGVGKWSNRELFEVRVVHLQ